MNRIVVLAVLLPSFLFAQHTIKGIFSPAKDYNVALLYKVTPTISDYVANTEINTDGTFEIQLDSTVTKGMYRLVYAIPQEDYNFDIIYNGKEDIELTFNAETGVKFVSSIENNLIASYTNSMSAVTHSIGKFFREQSIDTLALEKIFEIQRQTQTSFEEAAKETIAYHFIKANTPYIPEGFEDVETYVNNLKIHYFDHVDYQNETLQSSGFLEERMLNYVFGMSLNDGDEVANYKTNIDVFCGIIKEVPAEVKRILLIGLWEQMRDLGFENVANYISENYLMDVAVSLNDQELLNALIVFKNISVGNKAPDFSYEVENEKGKILKKLSDLNIAEKYILVFWSSTCSHCLDEVPQLQSFVQSYENETLKVIAIALEDEPTQWLELKQKYPEFIHVYGDGKWDNPMGNDYGVTATPSYFVLDKNKMIEAKPEDIEALKTLFESK